MLFSDYHYHYHYHSARESPPANTNTNTNTYLCITCNVLLTLTLSLTLSYLTPDSESIRPCTIWALAGSVLCLRNSWKAPMAAFMSPLFR